MNNSAQPSGYQLPDLMFEDMFVIPELPMTQLDSPEFDTELLLAQELLSDLMPSSNRQRRN